MWKLITSLSRFTWSRVLPPLLVVWDVVLLVAKIIPETRDRFSFRSFWGATASLDAYFVIDSYENVRLRDGFRSVETAPPLESLERLAHCEIIEGAFSPQAAALLTALFARHTGKSLHVVTDTELSPNTDAVLICYGTSDFNFKTFDIEAESGSSLCQYLFDANGQRAFRLGGQFHFMESRDGVIYDKAIVRRLTNRPFSNRSYVICAGLSEWGSLAAVCYLTRNWKELHKRFDGFGQRKDFCVLLEVPCGQFEYARELISAVWWEAKPAPNATLVSDHV